MPYARLLYHVVWVTKYRLPSITESREAITRASIAATSQEMDLAVYGVGIMPDHRHVFTQISPTLTVARPSSVDACAVLSPVHRAFVRVAGGL